MDQVFNEIEGLMDDRLVSKVKDSMGCGFQGGQDDKDFTANEADPKQFPGMGNPEDESALEFSEDDMTLYANQSLEMEREPGESPHIEAQEESGVM